MVHILIENLETKVICKKADRKRRKLLRLFPFLLKYFSSIFFAKSTFMF